MGGGGARYFVCRDCDLWFVVPAEDLEARL